ncbi:hypothetical protein M422DRAFT_52074 [Sphaerobolus stellatus SS14]|uniref:Uncharacterized protein n=1 Tax=Sphaerobolus stellatus (strain SS14) TaxID=990650 RepID=A0A0C9UHI3_SPHS4|nr:hypothetical protein M422DRAFT_52074 [Sphaerobolus stellatus SS14]
MSLMSDQMLADTSTVNGSSHPLYIAPGPLSSLPMHFQDPAAYGPLITAPQLDPNSPDLFKSNIHVAQQHAVRIQEMTQSIISSIERAYQPNGNHAIQASYFLRESGVGSLPLIAPDPSVIPLEQDMIENMTKSVQELFERSQKMQENAASVASLLSASEDPTKKAS